MDFSQLKELLTQFDESSIRFIDLTKADFHLVLNKDKAEMIQQPSVSVNSAVETVSVPKETETMTVVEQVVETTGSTYAGEPITSPLVGVVYLKPAPGEPTFKSVGDSVKKGDVLCIVEAMKVMNEIVSDQEGVIVEVAVENEEVVEYGQTLFTVK